MNTQAQCDRPGAATLRTIDLIHKLSPIFGVIVLALAYLIAQGWQIEYDRDKDKRETAHEIAVIVKDVAAMKVQSAASANQTARMVDAVDSFVAEAKKYRFASD